MTDTLKIMLVDDDRTTLEILGALLETRGYSVVQRDTAIGTTQAILRESPDVVLLDVRMPGLSGDKLAELISARSVNPPFVVLHSASPKEELEQLARRCGAAAAIEKTPDPKAFLVRFDALIASRMRRKPNAPPGKRPGG
jgi:DNA-binding response OmpR family regulator